MAAVSKESSVLTSIPVRQAGSDGHLEARISVLGRGRVRPYGCPEEVQRRVARARDAVWRWSPVVRSRMSRTTSACTRRRCGRGSARPRPTRPAARRRCSRALSVMSSSGCAARSASSAGQRDPAGRQRVFREGARWDPAEVSAFIEAQKAAGFAVELVCRTLGVSRSAHYQRASGQRSPRRSRDEQLVATIRELHAANFEAYGYRKLHLALRRAGVEDVGRDRVKRLMREHGIQGAKRRGKPLAHHRRPIPTRRGGPTWSSATSPRRGPDRLYVADFTYLRCWEGLVFFAFVIDVYSRRVVGWQLTGAHARLAGLRRAADGRLHPPAHGADVQLIHHSDRGAQYTSFEFGSSSTTTTRCRARAWRGRHGRDRVRAGAASEVRRAGRRVAGRCRAGVRDRVHDRVSDVRSRRGRERPRPGARGVRVARARRPARAPLRTGRAAHRGALGGGGRHGPAR